METRLAKLFAGAALALTCAAASAAPTLADCDGPFATVLHAAAPAAAPSSTPAASVGSEARAYWLDRQLLQWPGADRAGVFKLYYAAGAQLRADPGQRVQGADGALLLAPSAAPAPDALARRFKFIGQGPLLAVAPADVARIGALLTGQVLLVREAVDGTVLDATAAQLPGALDDLYASAVQAPDLGVTVGARSAGFKLWAPTAQAVAVCTYASGTSAAATLTAMRRDDATGIWSAQLPGTQAGRYYRYLVDVVAPGAGLVRNLVTDPYSVSLTTDSRRSYIADLGAAALKPPGWDSTPVPQRVKAQPDMAIYELHVRDFSINDASVSAANRGKYLAFTETGSNGMRHLAALSRAGMTDIHLLPVYDIATIPEQGCQATLQDIAALPGLRPDGLAQQAAIGAVKFTDCYNWGYDPYHYSAPEGSYARDAADGAARIVEFRRMVQALHRIGLRVGMDVVYNHTFVAGQDPRSVLDRVVPGYYHRLDARGAIERSTCCDNTATEHPMMAKLMIDSAALWAVHYKIDSFRFDLMGHQPRAAMEQLQARVNRATGRHINLIGEGWNFGEVADGARFVQASQLSLNGSGIGTFSDRARDAMRGGGAADGSAQIASQQGWINGLVYDPNAVARSAPAPRTRDDLMDAADMVRVGLAGSLRSYPMQTRQGPVKRLEDMAYGGNQPAGYASAPGETVNYVENHDNQTLFDINVFKLPLDTSTAERAQVQMLGAAINAFSQGVPYFHAGFDILRSKSLDRNSFESGDWFNRLDWTYRDNYFGTGLPPEADNGKDYPLMRPLLAQAQRIKPTPQDIAWSRDAFRDLLAIRASSTLFRLRTAEDVAQRLRFYNTGPQQVPTVIVGHLDGAGYPGARFHALTYVINADKVTQQVTVTQEQGRRYALHPVHLQAGAADRRIAAGARYDAATGSFTVPPRSAVVFVEP
ncbi:alpha-1,6-glucosidase [Duganella sp. Leaf126]|uniref:pullulanase-type alpha-1,6-glucosidase n=1 Tax=Duganella sp. Leaf126 TaxID=1736266 RepID=UPI0006FB90CF|nr:pullulanase-type alpha-1,6-glucosidase [Duganella sp. Leaf126]KQQ33573.1 alpha-1,6-glucosidase [Duganella sp. Leaf126]